MIPVTEVARRICRGTHGLDAPCSSCRLTARNVYGLVDPGNRPALVAVVSASLDSEAETVRDPRERLRIRRQATTLRSAAEAL